MQQNKKRLVLSYSEVTPKLDPEDRARRIEQCINTLAKANNVRNYAGCKFYPKQNRGEIYISGFQKGSANT